MSGAVALRDHLAAAAREEAARASIAPTVGGLINARGVIDALAAGRIDVGPLDSYSHDLLKHYDPALAAQVRTDREHRDAADPPLVATAPIGADALRAPARCAARHVSLRASSPRRWRASSFAGFAVPDSSDYDALAASPTHPTIPFEDL